MHLHFAPRCAWISRRGWAGEGDLYKYVKRNPNMDLDLARRWTMVGGGGVGG